MPVRPAASRSLFAVSAALVLSLGAGVACAAAAIQPPAEKAAEKAKGLSIGDPAPALQVEAFVKGEAVNEFKRGQVYVVEFWATWCGPCIRMFPHLSELQKKHAGKLTVIGVNIWEEQRYTAKTIDKVRKFVGEQGDRMAYTVAYDGAAKKMDEAYMKATGQDGIPAAFIVDGEGRVAWFGHPGEMDEPLELVIAGKWNKDEAKKLAEKKIEERKEMARQNAAARELAGKWMPMWRSGKKDEALPLMMEMIEKVPMVSGPAIDMVMNYLLKEKGDPAAASALGTKLVDGAFKDDAMVLNAIAWSFVNPENKVAKPDLPLAKRAAERATELTKRQNADILDTLARVHWLQGDKAKAIELQKQAIARQSNPDAKEELEKTLKEYEGK